MNTPVKAPQLIAASLALLLLVACGQRGPLYLPGEKDGQAQKQAVPAASPAASPAAAPAAVPADKPEKKESDRDSGDRLQPQPTPELQKTESASPPVAQTGEDGARR